MSKETIEIPEKIYLQIGDEVDLSQVNFNQLDHENVTWCDKSCFKNDLEYIDIRLYESLQKQLTETQSKLSISEQKVKLNYSNAMIDFEKEFKKSYKDLYNDYLTEIQFNNKIQFKIPFCEWLDNKFN